MKVGESTFLLALKNDASKASSASILFSFSLIYCVKTVCAKFSPSFSLKERRREDHCSQNTVKSVFPFVSHLFNGKLTFHTCTGKVKHTFERFSRLDETTLLGKGAVDENSKK